MRTAAPRFSIAIAVPHVINVIDAAAYDTKLPLILGTGRRFPGTGYTIEANSATQTRRVTIWQARR
jgi:hypothetical protein